MFSSHLAARVLYLSCIYTCMCDMYTASNPRDYACNSVSCFSKLLFMWAWLVGWLHHEKARQQQRNIILLIWGLRRCRCALITVSHHVYFDVTVSAHYTYLGASSMECTLFTASHEAYSDVTVSRITPLGKKLLKRDQHVEHVDIN